MFDLSNLNDYEFEILCKDIMERKLSVTLYTFSKGVDGGIDICDSSKSPQIVIQAKHYAKSKYSNLRLSFQKEVEKVTKINPKRYYVCTSLELTKKNKNEIVEMFGGYIDKISSVIDKVEIDSFLQLPENSDIVKKHYKLWLCATNVLSLIYNQNIFIDCAELMLDIEKSVSLFVDTKSFYESKDKLINNKVIIITGAPGVGKSTISKMLVLFFANEGYIVRYATDNNISDIKKVLSQDLTKKEIILLDDFLGQHYLKMKESQPNELKTLISFIEKSPNKKLIMNSRITIFKEAIQSSITFRELVEKHEINRYLIDLDKMPLLEKAEILYNHLYFNDLPNAYFINIKSDKNYFKIVRHKNYNPRIIEYVTKKRNYTSFSSDGYITYILNKLDNPEDVWKDEFRNRLDEVDRVLINTLYSLTDNMEDMENLERAFNKRIQKNKYLDTSVNPFKNTIIRLTDSLIKIVEQNGKRKISVLNPSINDYVRAEINTNPNEQVAIIDSANYIEQVFRMMQSEEARESVSESINTGNLLKMPVLKNSAFYYYLKLVVDGNIFNHEINKSLLLSVERAYENLTYECRSDYAQLYFKLLNQNFDNFYGGLKNIFTSTEKIHFIIKPMFLDDVQKLFAILIEKYPDYDDFYETFRASIVEKIQETVQIDTHFDINEIVSNYISDADSSEISSYMAEESDYLEDCIWDRIQDSIYSKIKDKLTETSSILKIKIGDFDVMEMKYYFDISGAIKEALKEDPESDDYGKYERGVSEFEIIENMFER